MGIDMWQARDGMRQGMDGRWVYWVVLTRNFRDVVGYPYPFGDLHGILDECLLRHGALWPVLFCIANLHGALGRSSKGPDVGGTSYGFSRRRECCMMRRVLNLGLCILLLPFALPLMVLISFLVCLDSQGPAMFVQERVGREGRHYRSYKFRTVPWNLVGSTQRAPMGTMETGVSGIRGVVRAVHRPFQDLQVTRVGRLLRGTRLDGLPQIFSVLKGDMSLVGPCPNMPPRVDTYTVAHGSAEHLAGDRAPGSGLS
jgi:lipopolysaccharide/colanic/teichoic acid biosynthesis glycosyltransferase